MDLTTATLLLAQATTPTAPNQTGELIKMAGWMVVMFVVFYFLLIRPQQKRQREHADLLKTIKPGDKISCAGGIIAVVLTVKEKTVTVRSADTKLEVAKSAVGEILERSGESSES
jgi:preprotein translocase subunit YajC